MSYVPGVDGPHPRRFQIHTQETACGHMYQMRDMYWGSRWDDPDGDYHVIQCLTCDEKWLLGSEWEEES